MSSVRRRDRSRAERVVAHLVGLVAIAIALGLVALAGLVAWLFRWFGLLTA